ncbi:serine hydrolase domain-containing protein [Algoriphagus taiwanensis]|uniref:Beta-lactamase-related domain-containing protein n=1 Tax=Algoriphagus taiwanensis TaxID=1445656 RepID=A0ABQ6PY82_9BACT|nr:hypothetical protein Ataiwa_08680 [Algoriphagus taiwanensis]
MNQKIKYLGYGLVFWFLLFLVWEWGKSHPKVRLNPVSFPQTEEERLDSLFSQSLTEFLIPGLAVGIVHEGKVVYLKAFGYENLESKDTMNLNSRIPVASISKIFTALALAQAGNERGFTLDTPLHDLFSKEEEKVDELGSITLTQLLTHTSGLRDPGILARLFQREKDRPLSQVLHQIPKKRGSIDSMHYADINFDLLGYGLEKYQNQPFEIILSEGTLQKAGMKSSDFVLEWPESANPMQGHGKTFLWKRIQPNKIRFERSPSPSSGLVSTPEDLAMVLVHLGRGRMGDFQKELDWLTLPSGKLAGFQHLRLNGQEFTGHYGGQAGYSSLFAFSNELKMGFFLLTNAKDISDHRKIIAERLLQTLSSNP